MKKRRVVQGQVFIWTRRGWRMVRAGYIRTRKGWRRMRRRPGRRRAPPAFPISEQPVPIVAVVTITEPAQPAATPSRQWPGKYATLRPDHGDGAVQSVAPGSPPSFETPTWPRNSEATFNDGRGSPSVKTFETQAALGGLPPSSASVPVS